MRNLPGLLMFSREKIMLFYPNQSFGTFKRTHIFISIENFKANNKMTTMCNDYMITKVESLQF